MVKTKVNTYRANITIALFACAAIFFLIGIWGTFVYATDDKHFYVYYILLTISSVLIGNIVVPLFSKPITESLIEDTNTNLSEIFEALNSLTGAVNSFKHLGISNITIGQDGFKWNSLISETYELKLAFKSSISWLTNHESQLCNFLAKKDALLKVLLPNDENVSLCNELAKQRKTNQDDIKKDIKKAKQILQVLSVKYPGKVQCKLSKTLFLSHFYIFNRLAIVTLRSLNNSHHSPHIVCENQLDGNNRMYLFCNVQFDEIWQCHSDDFISQ